MARDFVIPIGIHLLKARTKHTRCETKCEVGSKLSIKAPERRHWHCSDVFIVNFEHVSHLVLVFLMLSNCRLG